MGDINAEMVRVYVNLVQSDIEAAHRESSPVDNLELKAPRQPQAMTHQGS